MMRFPITLSMYIGKKFLASIGIAFGAVLFIAALADFVEIVRRTAEKTHIPLHIVMEMAFMKLPAMGERIFPYAMLIGSMMALTRLTKSHELIVARAAGVSVWQILQPAAIVSLGMGVLVIVLYNPIASSMIARFDVLEGRYIEGRSSQLAVSGSGLWIRQIEHNGSEMNAIPIGEYIIHAERVAQRDMGLRDVVIFAYDRAGKFIGRVDASRARLTSRQWLLEKAVVSVPEQVSSEYERYALPTELSIAQIQDSFADPDTLSFWQLTGFIDTLEKAGFSALRHRVHWHAMLATPLLFFAMVLIAAVFSLRLHRRGNVTMLLTSGALIGFVVNFMKEIFYAFGYAGTLPVALAAWSPPIIVLLAGTALLLHLEDG